MEASPSKEHLLSLAKNHPDAEKMVNNALNNLERARVVTSEIKKLEDSGYSQLARKLALFAIYSNPNDSFFVVQYGILCLKADDADAADNAVQEYKSKYGYPKNNPRFKILESGIYRHKKEFDKAIQVLSDCPRNQFVRNELAENYYFKEDFEEVKNLLIGDYQSNPDGALLLARIFAHEGSPDQAYHFLAPHLKKKRPDIDSYAEGLTLKTNPHATEYRIESRFPNELARFNREHAPDKTAFVMMTFSRGDSENDKLLSDVFDRIKLALDKYGLDAVRADEKDYSDTQYLWDNVQIYAMGCNYGIATLENLYESEMNPNVALEYGYMLAKGKKVLLLKERSFTNIRADLLGKIWKTFDIHDLKSIDNALGSWIGVDLGLRRLKS